MKKPILILLLAAWGANPVQANFIESYNPYQTIPAGNRVGALFNLSVSGLPGGDTVAGLTVGLNVSGGYNGGLYAYVVAPNGTLVTLVDRPGVTAFNPFGDGGAGLNVTLSDAAMGQIQTTPETQGAVLTGTYQAAASLAAINGSAADGTWSLFMADWIGGTGNPTLNSVTLDISTVSAPVPDGDSTVLLLGGGLAAVAAVKRRSNPVPQD